MALTFFFAAPAKSEEPFKEFLDRLISKKYFDVALDYLDEIEKNPATSERLKGEIGYHRARTLTSSIETISTVAGREKRLQESAAAYGKFIAEQPQHPLVSAARDESTRLLRVMARQNLDLAEKNTDAKKKAELLSQALGLLKKSTEQFIAKRDEIRGKLEPLEKKGEANAKSLTADELQLRDDLRSQYMIVRSDVAESLESEADALPADSPDRKTTLEKAAEEYKFIATKYSRYKFGVYARVGEGRCYKKLKRFPEAIKLAVEIVESSKGSDGIVKEASARRTGLDALLLAMECWTDESQKAYPAAMAASAPWLEDIQPAEEKEPAWVHLRYLAAVAHKRFSDEAKAKNSKDDNAKKALSEARKLAVLVSKTDSPDTGPARKLLAEMGIEVAASTPAALGGLKTFEEAKEAADDAYNAARELPARAEAINERLTVEQDPEQIKALKAQLEEAKGGEANGFRGALALYKRALQLAVPATPIDGINDVRTQMARCYYMMERFEEASVIGEFVAKRFPTYQNAKLNANIAMDSLKRLYLAAPEGEREAELPRLMAAAEMMTKNWPDDEDSQKALLMLLQFKINAKDYDAVFASLGKIPEGSAFRADAEAKIGRALWSQYLVRQNQLKAEAAKANPPAAPQADPAAEQMRLKGIELLQSSVKRFASSPPSAASIGAVASLADVFVKSGNPQQAIAVLEDPATGPMTLIAKEESKGLFDSVLAEQTCRVALSAQLALLPSSPDPSATIAKANAAMEKLSEILKTAEGAEDRVVKTYFTIARDMKEQLDLASDPKIKLNLANGAEKFLVGVRGGTKDPQLLRWVATTFLGLGQSFDTGVGKTPEEAKRFYTEAANGFEDILKREASKEITLEPDVKMQIRTQFASALRELGSYQAAMKELTEILKDPQHRKKVPFQLEAAQTLLEWGEASDAKRIDEAIAGRDVDPEKKTENIIWGLARISNLTRRDKRFASAFFESRYLISQCNFAKAKKLTGKEAKTQLELAKRDLASVYQLYPDLGGPEWQPKFEALMKRAQRELGEPEAGFSAIKKPAPKAAPSNSAAPVNSGT